jgi:hypothetical protein
MLQQTEMVNMGVGDQYAKQRTVTPIQTAYLRKVFAAHLICIQWQSNIHKQSLSEAFDLNTASSNFLTASVNANAHILPPPGK